MRLASGAHDSSARVDRSVLLTSRFLDRQGKLLTPESRFNRQLRGGLLPDSMSQAKDSYGRAVHLACPAGFIAELPFERWLRRMTDKPVLWLTACEHDHPHQLFAVQAEHMTPINSQGVKDGNHPKTRSLE